MRQSDVNAIIGLFSLFIKQTDDDFERALQSQNLDTEAPLRYELRDFSFTEHTRVARLTFVKIRTYRTVERYIQRNNQKHKIYSDWKQKESKIAPISLKLTNEVLENLRDEDFLSANSVLKSDDAIKLVAQFANIIIAKLVEQSGKSTLMPSWFKKFILQKKHSKNISDLKKGINNAEKEIVSAKSEIQVLELANDGYRNKSDKYARIRANKVLFILLSILSLGIYAYLNSEKRLEKLSAQLAENEQANTLKIEKLKQDIDSYYVAIKQNEDQIKNDEAAYKEQVAQIKPLDSCFENDSDFAPLKDLAGITYRKIKGVYVIRNRELGKVYVGQSKDVLKRLKDHFTGVVPKNIIFAEDYYKSEYENTDDLFEFKIEEIETKDELDNREKELIYEYDAFNAGYNKTSGNV